MFRDFRFGRPNWHRYTPRPATYGQIFSSYGSEAFLGQPSTLVPFGSHPFLAETLAVEVLVGQEDTGVF
jgi:hypothetical protein